MSDGQRQIEWLLANAERIQLQVTPYDWKLPFATDLVDCRTYITLGEQTVRGRASDNTEELAFLKSFCEALERIVFDRSEYDSSNGFAAHSTESDAIDRAQRELIERDRFLSHFLSQMPFFKPSINLSSVDFDSNILNYFLKKGFNLQLSEMRKTKDLYSFIFLVHGLNAVNPKGLCFGLGCNADPLVAARSAVMEALRHGIYLLNTDVIDSLTEDEFNKLSHFTPPDHQKLAFDLNYAREIVPYLFRQEDTVANIPEDLSARAFHSEILPLPVEMNDAPFAVAKAIAPGLSPLFFGPTTQANVNLNRLSQFTGRTITWDQVYKKIHPIA
jgi:Uncharacterized conserved protein